jgi:hypothetical protein
MNWYCGVAVGKPFVKDFEDERFTGENSLLPIYISQLISVRPLMTVPPLVSPLTYAFSNRVLS